MSKHTNYNKPETIKEENVETKIDKNLVEDITPDSVTPTEETANAKTKQKALVANCKKLNVRKKPDMNSDVLEIIVENDEVEIEELNDSDFYKVITSSGVSGFCVKKYISVL